MTSTLSVFLSDDELTQVNADVKAKIEKELALKESTLDSVKAELDKVRSDYEQKCYDMDKSMIDISAKLDIETNNCTRATEKVKDLEAKMAASKIKIDGLEESYAESQGEIAALKHSGSVWKDEKLSMQHLIETRDLELKELKAEWKALSDKLAAAVTARNELDLKLDELQNSGVTVQYHNKRLEQERELLSQQNSKLSKEITAKSNELNSLKLSSNNDIVSLRSKLELKMDECKQLNGVNDNLRDCNTNLEKKVAQLLEKMNTADEERQSMEELYRNELQSMTNLCELYKASAKDEESKSKELQSAVQELQELANDSANAKKQADNLVSEWVSKAQAMNNEIEMQKKELEKANDLLLAQKKQGPQNLSDEELAALCPSAAMASKFIKSGMTLTEIYTKYVETLDDLEVAKHESKRMSDIMDDILQELQEKAPILKQQKEDYERALATVTQLTSQLDAAAIDCQRLKADTDDATRKLGKVEREKNRLESETRDLSTQVKYLVKELEENRGQSVIMDTRAEADANVSSSSEVITEHLVTFKNIDELQEQNRRLLRVVRELGEDNEKRENESRDEEIQELKKMLVEAKEELEHLRQERTKQIDYVETIVRQRDMFRVLLSQESKGSIPLSMVRSPGILTPTKAAGDIDQNDTAGHSDKDSSKALQVLKQEFDEYKKESQENSKVMNEQTDNLRSQISNLRADNAKLRANVDFTNEKYELLKETFENVRKESDMVREKNTKLLVMIEKHELNYNKISNDLVIAQQQKSVLQTKIENLRSEIDILRRAEEHVRSENSSLKRDQHGQSVLLANLQKIQQSMEKQDLEVRSELRSRIDSLTREIEALRKSGNEALKQKQASLQMIEKQFMNSQQALSSIRTEKDTLLKNMQQQKEELEDMKVQNQSYVSKISVLEQRLSRTASNLSGDPSQDDTTLQSLKESKEKIKSLQGENSSLKMKYEREQRAAQQYKECAAAVEESLKQSNEANRELSDAMEARLKAASEHQIKLEQKITVLEDENRQLNSKKTSLISEVDRRTSDLNRQLTSLQDELNMVLQREKELRRSEQEARHQYQEQAHLIAEAQNKYQREMVLHAESVKELMELKESNKKTDEMLGNKKLEAEQAKHMLDSSKGMWEKQKGMLVNENEELMERTKDLSGQISALHGELENMSSQLVALQQKKASDPPVRYKAIQDVGTASAEDPAGKSHEQLMDIIRYLRKEKNLYEVKYEVTQTENNRLKQQIAHLQNNVDQTKKALRDQQQKSQATSSELAKHEALMKKVETLNVLTDSNRMLRDENGRLQEELQSTKTTLSELKEKLTPLQNTNTQLTTQKDVLETEKRALEQDVQRWQQRSQQLLQSPKRQDPEEYRKLMGEKQRLTRSNEVLNKEVTERKLEISNLQGEIRNLNQQTESLRLESTNASKKIETLLSEAKSKQTEVEEKSKTIAQIRRVGRRYKMQFEELQAKLQAIEAKEQAAATENPSDSSQEQTAALQATNAELNAKVSALEASLNKINKEKEDTQSQLATLTTENDSLKTQVEIANKKSDDENKASSNNASQEIQKLTTERDEMKKQLQEKDDKSKRLLTLAKTRIEQFRRDKDELATERNQLKEEEQRLKESLENLKQAVKKETDQKMELTAKVEELQKQISAANLQQQQQNKVNTVVGHQSHAGSSSNVELRKAVNIRPISTQRVSQVSPMRVTRTARVMPEPQQDAQEGSSTDVTPVRSTSQLPSSLGAVGTSVGSSVTRAFVHPMTLPSGRQPPVVSSTPTSAAPPTTSGSPDLSQAEALVSRGTVTHTSSSTDAAQAQASSSAVNSQPSDVTESDQAIVSSSDDQTSQPDESQTASASPATVKTSSTMRESEDVPSQSASSSGDSSVSGSTISVLIGRQPVSAQKRPYEDLAETNTAADEIPASSSDAQTDVPPVSKRQRSTPDQSSAAGPSSDTSTTEPAAPSQVSEAGSSSSVSNLQAADTQGVFLRQEEAVGTSAAAVGTSSAAAAIPESMVMGSDHQSMPTSSGAGDVIVLSSDDDGSQPGFSNVEQDSEMYNAGEETETVVPEVPETEQAPQQHYIPSRPVLEPLNPTQPDVVRTRTMIRPAPLTPGLVPPAADDGDGIVPCTPTLPTRRHDDYQAINSPHVPANSVPIRFRFEDVPSQSIQPQSGILSVDNTIMDFSDAARSVPTTPNPIASVTTVTHVMLEQQQTGQPDTAAVTSSIMEEGEVEDEDDTSSDMNVPSVAVSSEEPAAVGNVQSESQAAVSYLQSKRGRRIKLIGGRSRGKDASSPSTSNQ